MFTPEFIADVERHSGKDFAEMSVADIRTVSQEADAEAVLAEADADQANADARIIMAAMDRRNAQTTRDMVAALRPTDDDFAEVTDALMRMGTRLRSEN